MAPSDSDQSAAWVALLSILPVLFVTSYYPDGLVTEAYAQTGSLLPHLLTCAGFVAATVLQWALIGTSHQFLAVAPYCALVLTTHNLETIAETTRCSTLCAFHNAALVIYVLVELVVLRVYVRVSLAVMAVPTATLLVTAIARGIDPEYEYVLANAPDAFRVFGFVELAFFIAARLSGASVVAAATAAAGRTLPPTEAGGDRADRGARGAAPITPAGDTVGDDSNCGGTAQG